MRAARLAAFALCLGGAACQTGAPAPVYLDPASNLGVPSGTPSPAAIVQQPGATAGAPGPAPVALSLDAQGQPNDEFDGQSWIEYRRGQASAAVPMRPRARQSVRGETIPLLPAPGERELDPRMYDPTARR